MPATSLFILKDGPYGTERSFNGLRLAGALAKSEGEHVQVFLLGDAASCAKSGQKVPHGYYVIERMLSSIVRHDGEVGVGVRNLHGCTRDHRTRTRRGMLAQQPGRIGRVDTNGRPRPRLLI